MPDLFHASRVSAPAVSSRQAVGCRAAEPPKPAAPAIDAAEQRRRDENHLCRVCGVYAGFGFGGSMLYGRPYRWGCGAHRDAVERMAA